MVIFGSTGTVAITENLTKAFSEDLRIREDDEDLPPAGVAFDAKNIVPDPVYGLRAQRSESVGNRGSRVGSMYLLLPTRRHFMSRKLTTKRPVKSIITPHLCKTVDEGIARYAPKERLQ